MDQKRLVEVIRRHPQIWDRSQFLFRDKDIRDNAWASVENQMGVCVEVCKETFKFLREKYIRERDKVQQNNSKQWELLSELKFLEPNIVPRKQPLRTDVKIPEEFKCQINQDTTIQCDTMTQTESDKVLIDLIRETTPIWNRNSNAYTNKQLKLQLWENIATKLNMETNVCMLRWKALREKYIRQKTRFQVEGEKWELLDNMGFLDKVIHYRKKGTDDDQQHQGCSPIMETYQTYQNVKVEPTILIETESYGSHNSYNDEIDDNSSLNDSSIDSVKALMKHENAVIEIADSSSRKRSISINSDDICEKRQHIDNLGKNKSPEELFGDLVAAMLSQKPEKSRNMYMIEIMNVLSK